MTRKAVSCLGSGDPRPVSLVLGHRNVFQGPVWSLWVFLNKPMDWIVFPWPSERTPPVLLQAGRAGRRAAERSWTQRAGESGSFGAIPDLLVKMNPPAFCPLFPDEEHGPRRSPSIPFPGAAPSGQPGGSPGLSKASGCPGLSRGSNTHWDSLGSAAS